MRIITKKKRQEAIKRLAATTYTAANMCRNGTDFDDYVVHIIDNVVEVGYIVGGEKGLTELDLIVDELFGGDQNETTQAKTP